MPGNNSNHSGMKLRNVLSPLQEVENLESGGQCESPLNHQLYIRDLADRKHAATFPELSTLVGGKTFVSTSMSEPGRLKIMKSQLQPLCG